MDAEDKSILEADLAGPIGRAVSQWMRKHEVAEPVSVSATVSRPTCYIDESGIAHYGPLVVCNVQIIDDEYFDDDEDF